MLKPRYKTMQIYYKSLDSDLNFQAACGYRVISITPGAPSYSSNEKLVDGWYLVVFEKESSECESH